MRLAGPASILSAFLAVSPAGAADCLQEQAIYGDADNAYKLHFEPVGSASAATSNHFKVKVGKTDLVLDGIVMQSDEPVRANGMIMHKCPEGDVTGDDIAACTIWQGVIYSVSADGKVLSLPGEGLEAAAQVLLPDFGPAIRNSSIWGKATVAPWDVLTFKGCSQ
ncbi:hypothetical protein ASE23_17400 [Rhizobium sp. Root73]|uniref:hypothetical protein n=1 Tax=unclassified Rhizobium TaxID=2613769 RepID=UPI000729478D|nr:MULTISPECIES: hypothetical protein [unclassified Rhizobium]KQY01905.1 hypothetical protein ASD36_17405 [Rhizobium sp. Root1334]KRB97480.1 hypothetical protein ASE23_17400 [Rhizobium sp. Root73]